MAEDPPRISRVTTDPDMANQDVSTEPSPDVVREGSKGERPFLSNAWGVLNVSLSRFQAVVGLLAGIISITGAVFSATQFFKPAPSMGEVVAVVQEAKSGKAVSDATLEILTPQNALVTTLRPDALGRVRHALKEGTYRVRVSHSRFGAEVQHIQVFSGQTVALTVRLRPGSSSPLEHAERAVNEGLRAVRRLFGL